MNAQLEMIKALDDNKKKCELVEELIALQDAEIALLKNTIEELRLLLKAKGYETPLHNS